MEEIQSASAGVADRANDGYERLMAEIGSRVMDSLGPLFYVTYVTKTQGQTGLFRYRLFDEFLSKLPDDARQHYDCNACRHFINRYGGVVTIDSVGGVAPLIWPAPSDVPEFFREAVVHVRSLVLGRPVEGVFLDDRRVWGEPQTGDWSHFAAPHVPDHFVFKSTPVRSARQAMAEKREEFRMMVGGGRDKVGALDYFNAKIVDEAVRALRGSSLIDTDGDLAAAEWLSDLYSTIKDVKGQPRRNLIWLAVAKAAGGWCHVKRNLLGSTLLEGIKEGKPFTEIARAWNTRAAPDKRMRPTVAPTEGNKKRAEDIVEKLGVSRSLQRRYATVGEITAFWREPLIVDAEFDAPAGGVFANVRTKDAAEVKKLSLPMETMTWAKFKRDVLPTVLKLEAQAPSVGPFTCITNAVHADAPIIFKHGNPFNQWAYTDSRNQTAHRWNLKALEWARVAAICAYPEHWFNEPRKGESEGATFVIEGCKPLDHKGGNALFPDDLIRELFEVRATIEEFSKHQPLHGEASACGLRIGNGPCDIRLRVNDDRTYRIDRWE